MFIMLTPEGSAYRTTDGMPAMFRTLADVPYKIVWQGLEPEEIEVLELSESEARHINEQAFISVYGRRAGLDV